MPVPARQGGLLLLIVFGSGQYVSVIGQLAVRQQIQHRHPNGHAVLYLLQDDSVVRVGHVAAELHAAVDGARVQHGDGLR